jgi:hypothetical protein
MRKYTMPDRQALDKIRPRHRAARNQLLAIAGYSLLGAAAVATIVYSNHRTQQYRQQNWNSAVAVVEDVRPKLVGQANGQAGGGMLYNVEVLAKFSADGKPQERWIDIEQIPRGMDSVKFQERLWKGNKYTVRWNPSNSNQIAIEIH